LSISYDQREEGLKLYFKGVDAISTLMEERIKEDFANYDPNNYDNLPEAPKDHLTEEERINFFGKQLVMYIKGQMLS
jgi:hypothetical protein